MINNIMDHLDFTSNKVQFKDSEYHQDKDGKYYRNGKCLPRRHIVQEVIIDLGECGKNYTIVGDDDGTTNHKSD